MTTYTFPIKALEAISLFAAKDDPRHVLKGVLVEPLNQETRLVATDGHKLGLYRTKLDEPQATSEPFILGNGDIKAILQLAKAIKAPTVTIAPDFPSFTAEAHGSKISGKLIDGKFPEYRRVFPAIDQEDVGKSAQFDVNLLVSFAKAAKVLGIDLFNIYIRHAGYSGALVTLRGDPNFLGVVMPYYAEEPDWSWLLADL